MADEKTDEKTPEQVAQDRFEEDKRKWDEWVAKNGNPDEDHIIDLPNGKTIIFKPEVMNDGQHDEEVEGYVTEAINWFVSECVDKSPFPPLQGVNPFRVTRDIVGPCIGEDGRQMWWTLHENTSLLMPLESMDLYTEVMDFGDLEIVNADSEDEENPPTINFTVTARPLIIDGKQATLMSLASWAYVGHLRGEGKRVKADRLMRYLGYEEQRPDEQKAQLPVLEVSRPEKHIAAISKLSKNVCSTALLSEDGHELIVANKGKADEKWEKVALQKLDGTPIDEPLKPIDLHVSDHIASIAATGRKSFTDKQVAQLHYGVENPTKGQIKEIHESIQRLRASWLRLDMTHSYVAEYDTLDYGDGPIPLTDNSQLRMRDPLLMLKDWDFDDGQGGIVAGYIIVEAPILMRHAHLIGEQIASWPTSLSVLPVGSRQPGQKAELKQEVFKWVEEVRHEQAKPPKKRKRGYNSIGIDTLLEKAGYDTDGMNQTTRSRLVKFVRDVLDTLKPAGIKRREIETGEELGDYPGIKSYRVVQDKNTHKNVKITVTF